MEPWLKMGDDNRGANLFWDIRDEAQPSSAPASGPDDDVPMSVALGLVLRLRPS